MTEEINMKDGDAISRNSNDGDVDVLWEGSPLHEHLIRQDEMLLDSSANIKNDTSSYVDINEEAETRHAKKTSQFLQPNESNGKDLTSSNIQSTQVRHHSSVTSSAKSFAWPESRRIEILQVEVARQLLESDLLVQEDEDFINNFLLTDAALEDYHKYTAEGGASSVLGDMLLFSGR